MNIFISQGKTLPALNQFYAFICKVEDDAAADRIDAGLAADLLFLAGQIVLDLNGNPAGGDCN